MFQDTKICVTCGEEFQIHHVAQKHKKYCGYRCADHKWAAKRRAENRKLKK